MLNDNERLFIINQFKSKDYCKNDLELENKCKNLSFISFSFKSSENANNCGDYIAFAVRKNSQRIKEIFFSGQEACVIVVSATNILCKWVVEKKKSYAEMKILLSNVKKMINDEEYELGDCQEIKVFSSLKSFAVRKSCLLLVVESFFQIIRG